MARSIENARIVRGARGSPPSEVAEREYISFALSVVSKAYFGALEAAPDVEDVSVRFANGFAEVPVAFRRALRLEARRQKKKEMKKKKNP